jgi:hypothetical protein
MKLFRYIKYLYTMRQQIILTESERKQILGMHKKYGYKMSIRETQESTKIEHHLDNVVNQLSDEEVHQLQQQLADIGITPETSVKQAVDIVKQGDNMETDMNEDMKKQKAADILSNIGTGLVASTLVPLIPLGIGHALNIGFGGGLAIHLAVAGLLIGLAKALGKKEGSTEHGNN